MQRLACVDERVERDGGILELHDLELAELAARVRFEMYVAVDQSGQHETRAQVDDTLAAGNVDKAVANFADAAVPNHDRARPARRLAGTVEQSTGLHHDDVLWGCGRAGIGGNGWRLGRRGGADRHSSHQGSKQGAKRSQWMEHERSRRL